VDRWRERRTDGYDEANRRYSRFIRKRLTICQSNSQLRGHIVYAHRRYLSLRQVYTKSSFFHYDSGKNFGNEESFRIQTLYVIRAHYLLLLLGTQVKLHGTKWQYEFFMIMHEAARDRCIFFVPADHKSCEAVTVELG
jgi:hypothetical protein